MIDPKAATSWTLDPHRAVTLPGSRLGWRIDRGMIDVFARPSGARQPGARRFLFTARAGDVVFGLTGGGYTVLVVPLEPTRVSRLDLDQMDAPSSRATVDAWTHLLAGALGEGAESRPDATGSGAEALKAWQEWAAERLAAFDVLDAQHRVLRRASHLEVSGRAARSAVRRLIAIGGGRKDEDPTPDGSPLFQVVAAVGRQLGLAVRPALGEADTDEFAAIQRRSRFHARQVLLTDGWWRRDNGPLVGRMRDDGRPVALLPNGPCHYTLFDPSAATRSAVDAEAAAALAPVAFSLYRRLRSGPPSAASFLRFGMRGRGRDVLATLGCGLLATALAMAVAPATAVLLDVAIPDANRPLLAQLGLGLLAAAVGRTLFEVTQVFAVIRLETAAASSAQSAVWARVLDLPLPLLRRYSTGDLHSRIAAVDGIRERLSASMLRAVFAGAASLLNVALLFWYGAWMALWTLPLLTAMVVAAAIAGSVTLRAQTRLQELAGESAGLSMQLVQNVAKLRVAAAEGRAFERWSATYAEQQRLVWRIQRVQDIFNVFLFVLPAVALACLLGLASGTRSLATGGLTPGAFLAFSAALGALVAGVSVLVGTLIESADFLTLWRRVRPLVQAEPEVYPFQVDPGGLRGQVALDNVTFRYRSDGAPTLDHVTLRAAPGEFIALVGPSGSGKSTILRLLLGFETPESGAVFYDEQDLAGLDVQAVRRHLGVVLQQSRVMAASVFENIAAGATLSLSDAWEAARRAGLAADIESFPMAMHTFVTEGGTNLSGGQRQRLLIARALAMKPRILILDEATSALDNRTQSIVSRSLKALGVTRIVIAHRLSTVRQADRIYVIEQGRVVQSGRFEDLAAAGGLFGRLMARETA